MESNKLPNNISEIIKKLPPPIYKVQIFLNRSREKNDERSQTDEILFSRLSSGEKQFAYMMSTYIYHLANLESIHIASKLTPMPLQRVAYSMINMIFDEMELCFHPEYQRTFVNNLVSYIKRAGLNKVFSFNVILTTHSPFILSDIPACNILALKDGMPDDSFKNERTFAGNIYDILGNNFFMENFIGEFASKEIDRIINRLTNGKWIPEKGRPIIKSKIDIIGDDVIRIKLLEKLGDGDDIRERVKILNAELKEYNDI